MKKSNLMPTIVLGSICLFAALLLSVINTFTAPIIAERENAKANAALTEVLPGGSNFQKLTLNESYPEAVTEAYSADGGFVFRSVGKGRNGDIVVMIGVNTDGQITGTQIISEGESKGYKEKVFSEVLGTEGKYTGQTLESYSPVLVGGSTMTSNGFAGAIKAALNAYAVANGGEADNRTPEQKLNDNLNNALGTEGKSFTPWIGATLSLGGKVYVSDSGTVIEVGSVYVGYDVNGNLLTTAASDADKAIALEAYTAYSTAEKIDLSAYDGINSEIVTSAWVVNENYVITLEAKGYGINATGKYSNKSNKPTYIEISIDKDGKIISCVTTDENETATPSDPLGTVCGNEDYYTQYNGKTESDIDSIGIIAGATLTTNGYHEAIKEAINAVKILGGNE